MFSLQKQYPLELSSLYFIVKHAEIFRHCTRFSLCSAQAIRGRQDLIESPHTECQDLKPPQELHADLSCQTAECKEGF